MLACILATAANGSLLSAAKPAPKDRLKRPGSVIAACGVCAESRSTGPNDSPCRDLTCQVRLAWLTRRACPANSLACPGSAWRPRALTVRPQNVSNKTITRAERRRRRGHLNVLHTGFLTPRLPLGLPVCSWRKVWRRCDISCF